MSGQRISDETRQRIAQVWPDIIEQIACGQEIRVALSSNMVTRDMARAYMASDPSAREQWNEAKTDSADAYFDEVRAIANNRTIDPASARVSMDGFRWLAGKRNPRDYSDKATLDVNVRSVDLTRIISDAQARLEASRIVGNAALLGAIEGQARRLTAADDTQLIDLM